MSYNISKELFEAVTGKNYELFDGESNYHIIYGSTDYEKSITYNVFFFECKEWALGQGYVVYSSSKSASVFKDLKQVYMSSNDSSEQQAVFDACQWIVENKDK